MEISEVQPGLFRESLNDEERRRKYSVKDNVIAALRGEPGSKPLFDALSESYKGVHESPRKRSTRPRKGRRG